MINHMTDQDLRDIEALADGLIGKPSFDKSFNEIDELINEAVPRMAAEIRRLRAEKNAPESRQFVKLPCPVGETVYIVTERYFECADCRYGSGATYHKNISRMCCDVEDVHCPLKIETRIVQGFTIGENGVSAPGEWGYEGLQEFSGIDGKWHLMRIDAEASMNAMIDADATKNGGQTNA